MCVCACVYLCLHAHASIRANVYIGRAENIENHIFSVTTHVYQEPNCTAGSSRKTNGTKPMAQNPP